MGQLTNNYYKASFQKFV